MITEDTKIVGRAGSRLVEIDGRALTPAVSQRVLNHSPDGFNWGYGGSGPAQLALAIMLETVPDKFKALALYQQFKLDVIKPLPVDKDFEISGADVIAWLSRQNLVSVQPIKLDSTTG